MNTELVLIPCTLKGHLTPEMEFAKLLVTRNQMLSITVLLIKYPLDQHLASYADSLAASFASDRIKFIDITRCADPSEAPETNPVVFIDKLIESHKSRVRSAVDGLPKTTRLVGFLLDPLCMSVADVAAKLGVPTYVFSPSSAGHLCLSLLLENRESIDLEADHSISGFTKPVPGQVLPSVMFNSSASLLIQIAKRVKESRGVVVNTSAEIEPYALKVLTFPKVYAVGPVLSLPDMNSASAGASGEAFSGSFIDEAKKVTEWLDDQPPASVLYLCFGSVGSFCRDQVREIAKAIESVGVQFLWTLRKNSADVKMALSSDIFTDPSIDLPEGFLERTAGRGRVIGWAPQTAVLAHPAVGGFVSHCGWNSILESLWFGVPVATWPLYAEQQLNAFEMVVELGLAVEVKMDYRFGFNEENGGAVFVSAEVIENAIRKVMDREGEIRKRVKEMSFKCRNTVINGGSSFSSLDHFVNDILGNLIAQPKDAAQSTNKQTL